MTPERFREVLQITGISDGQLIRLVDVDDRLVRRWKTGERAISDELANWLEDLVKYFDANPPPVLRGRARE